MNEESRNNTAEEEPVVVEPFVLSSDVVERALQKENHKDAFKRVVASTIGALVVIAAAVVIVVVLLFPVIQISGDSMSETLHDSDIVIALNGGRFRTGDVIAFYYGNDILLKRVIASSGQWVDMDAEGNVYVDNELLEEPYISEKAMGNCTIEFPYQVPEGRVFVMGDHRRVSVDSRNRELGCIESKVAMGKVFFRIWPLSGIGFID